MPYCTHIHAFTDREDLTWGATNPHAGFGGAAVTPFHLLLNLLLNFVGVKSSPAAAAAAAAAGTVRPSSPP